MWFRGPAWHGVQAATYAGLLVCLTAGQTITARAQTNTVRRTRGAAAAVSKLIPEPIAEEDTRRFQAAAAAYDAGRLQEARPEAIALAARYSGRVEVQTLAGSVLAEAGDVAGAVPYLERARRLGQPTAALLTNLGVAYLKLGRGKEAVEALRRAAALAPREAQAEFTLGQALMLDKQFRAAAEAFSRARALDSGGQIAAADLRYDQALALWSAGEGPGAAALLEGAPELAGSAAEMELLGEVEEGAGRFEAAAKHFEAAARLEPSEANLYAYGAELLRHWTFAPAAEVFRFGAAKYPASPRMQMGLGIALFGDSDYKGAVPVFRAMLDAAPKSEAVADLLGRSCSAAGTGEEPGCDSLAEFARRHPKNAPAALYAAIVLLHRPDTTGAEPLLRSAIAANPALPEAWYNLGMLEQTRGAWAESAASLENAVALRPEYAEAHYRLARAYSHLDRREEARAQIALQQRYAEQEKQANAQRLHEVVTFIMQPKP